MGARQGVKKRGVPAGRKALVQAEKEDSAEIERLAALLPDSNRPSYFRQIGRLANANIRDIPPHLREAVERLYGINARELLTAWEKCLDGKNGSGGDRTALLKPLWDQICRRDDAHFEKECGLMPGDAERWKRENPGRTARPGEVWRWVAEQQEKADEERGAKVIRNRAAEIASRGRDMSAPCPGDMEILSAFEQLRGKDWSDREEWPTVDSFKEILGMPRKRILIEAKAGRWGARDVWRGATCRSKKGGCPPVKLSPRAVGKVLRAFGKRHPSLSADAGKLADYLFSLER